MVGNTLYFRANDGSNGQELWKSDGTANGTSMVRDINPGSAPSYPGNFYSFNNKLYVGSDASFGGKLYVASTLTKGGGSFDIVHPDPSKPIGSRLRHCFVEAPTRGDNMYRYKISAVDLSASFALPSYYKFLNEDTQIWVNPVNCLGSGFGILDSDNETVQIKVSQDGDYNVLIIGTRKDQMMIEFFDNAGGAEYYVGNKNNNVSNIVDVSINVDISFNSDVSDN
jgi:ELWxxDGT repeat protein